MKRLALCVLLCLAFVAVPILREWPVVTLRATSASDDFNRADSGTLGANWTDQLETIDIASNTAAGPAEFSAMAHWAVATNDFGDDQCSQLTVTSGVTGGAGVGVTVRATDVNPNQDFYWFRVDGTNYNIDEFNNGSIGTGHASGALAITGGDSIRLCAQGTTMTAYKNGVVVTSITDGTLTTGQPGITTFGTTPRVDDWSATDVFTVAGSGLTLLGVGR